MRKTNTLPFGQFLGKKMSFWLSACFHYGAVASSASFFPFGVLDGRC